MNFQMGMRIQNFVFRIISRDTYRYSKCICFREILPFNCGQTRIPPISPTLSFLSRPSIALTPNNPNKNKEENFIDFLIYTALEHIAYDYSENSDQYSEGIEWFMISKVGINSKDSKGNDFEYSNGWFWSNGWENRRYIITISSNLQSCLSSFRSLSFVLSIMNSNSKWNFIDWSFFTLVPVIWRIISFEFWSFFNISGLIEIFLVMVRFFSTHLRFLCSFSFTILDFEVNFNTLLYWSILEEAD